MEELFNKVNEVIDMIRPYINADGGDITLTRIEDNIAYVQMHGACVGCGLLDATLNEAVSLIVKEEVPEIQEVRLEEENQNVQ